MSHNQFWWFQGDSVVELAARLAAADPTTARLEVRIDADHHMTFRVVDTRPADQTLSVQMGTADINNSWLCPPACPT